MKKLSSILLAILLVFSMSVTSFAQDDPTEDTQNPSDVENLAAVPLDGAVKLTWSAAFDDVAVTGYQVHYGLGSVTEEGGTYDFSDDAGDVLEFIVEGLENDTTYYFSAIAYDAAGNESVYWATEVEATPSADAGTIDDADAPQVSSAEAINREEVAVVFSEAVVLPEEDAELAFLIENENTFEPLDVVEVKIDEDDASGKTVILRTVEQVEGDPYKLTVGTEIEDMSGNPIFSGTSDTAIFNGSGLERPLEDVDAPLLTSIEVVDATHIIVQFNEAVELGIDPSQNFNIILEDDATASLEVLGVELGQNDEGLEDAAVILTTSTMEAKSYILVAIDLEDEAGNVVSASQASGTFMGFGEVDTDTDTDTDTDVDVDVPDTIAPSDVASFLSEKLFQAGGYVVRLSWSVSEADLDDVAEQLIYMSTDLGNNYVKQASLAPTVEEYEVSGLAAGEYWFKHTRVDAAGNESEGVITKLTLPEVGPEMAGLLLLSLGLGRIFGRRRRK